MYVISKIFSFITQPMAWVVLVWVIALLMLSRWRKTAVMMLWAGLLATGLLGFQAIPDLLLRDLENRFTVPSLSVVSQHSGVIILGGVIGNAPIHTDRGQLAISEAAERITVPLALMRSHPRLQLVFSGGAGGLLTQDLAPEADLAEKFFREQGVAPERMWFERASRNTQENAQQTAKLLRDQCGKHSNWLLVTSAFHMSRAKKEFDQALAPLGCRVTPYPVDFRTANSTPWTNYSLADSLVRWQTALHEVIGSWVYARWH
jgi:uncharacterized SAM-binding protein YcdF (DUF218 family)